MVGEQPVDMKVCARAVSSSKYIAKKSATGPRTNVKRITRLFAKRLYWKLIALVCLLATARKCYYLQDDDHVPGSTQEIFNIIVLTMDRHEHLRHLLRSLNSAHYNGATFKLEILVDLSTDSTEVQRVAHAFDFKHGSKSVRLASRQRGLAVSWYKAWEPDSRSQRAIILEDDIVLSPYWYAWLSQAWDKYGDLADLAGISLQRQVLIPRTPSKQMEIVNRHEPFLFPLVGSIGFSPNARVWKEFLKWVNALPHGYDVSVPALITSTWWNKLDKRHMWTQHFIYFCLQRNLYTMYVNMPGHVTLAQHVRAKGAHFSKDFGPDFAIMRRKAKFIFPDELVKYDWSGEIQNTKYLSFDEVSASALKHAVNIVNERNGFMYVMFVNRAYSQMARSWLCNILFLNPDVLRSTFIIADSFATVRELSSVRVTANYFVFETGRENDASFGTYNYYRVVMDRIMAEKVILNYGANIMIIEADQTWFSDLGPTIRSAFSTQADLIAGDERSIALGEEKSYICGGFYGIAASASGFFNNYVETHLKHLEFYENTTGVIDLINDQALLTTLAKEAKLKVFWFDKCDFATGKWFSSEKYRRACPRPKLIHNNYLVGNQVKIQRAKEYNHWFFNELNDTCEKPFSYRSASYSENMDEQMSL